MRQADEKFIAGLHPNIREKVTNALNAANAALTGRAQAIITSGMRTFAEQQALYDQGRTKPGQRVTNAEPGKGFHNYGLAIDFCLLKDGKTLVWDINTDLDGDHIPDWMEVVKIFKANGFVWGGDWVSLKDYPHFEMTFGHDWRDLLALHNQKVFIPGTTFVMI